MSDQVIVDKKPGNISALQRQLEGFEGFSSVSRVKRNALKNPIKYPVSNAVPDFTKLQYQHIITDLMFM
jgi:hypothetical protein